MPRFIRSADSERALDLHDLVTVGVDEVAEAIREAVDAGDMAAVVEFAEQLALTADAIEKTVAGEWP